MKAFRFKEWKKPAQLEDVPVPDPRSGEVLIKVGGAGACHSDLHIMHEFDPASLPGLDGWQLPITLGHENAGWIEGGDIVDHLHLDLGAPVVVSPTWSCGVCAPCRQGATNYCEQATVAGGLGRDGGMAEYMVAPAHTLVPLGNLEPWQAAPLTDAGLTSYHAIRRCLPLLTPDTTAVVIGAGGLGHLGIQILRELSGCQIIVVDTNEAALEMARELGAHICLPSDENTAAEIRKATGGLGAMVILDFVGIDATLAMAAQAARQRGEIVLIGIGGGTLSFRFGTLPYACSVVTTYGGSTGELAELLALAEAGRIQPHIEEFPLDQVATVYERLHRNDISGRAVLRP
jgi:propanol-preferring alcohol dehydrogenase